MNMNRRTILTQDRRRNLTHLSSNILNCRLVEDLGGSSRAPILGQN